MAAPAADAHSGTMDFICEAPTGATSGQYFAFDITANEMVEGPVDFEADQLVFCFEPSPGTSRIVCRVKLQDKDGSYLMGGEATLEISADQSQHGFLTFKGFGWYDEGCRFPVSGCRYRVSLDDGDSRVRVRVYGFSPDYAYANG